MLRTPAPLKGALEVTMRPVHALVLAMVAGIHAVPTGMAIDLLFPQSHFQSEAIVPACMAGYFAIGSIPPRLGWVVIPLFTTFTVLITGAGHPEIYLALSPILFVSMLGFGFPVILYFLLLFYCAKTASENYGTEGEPPIGAPPSPHFLVALDEYLQLSGSGRSQTIENLKYGTLKGRKIGSQWYVHIETPPGNRERLISVSDYVRASGLSRAEIVRRLTVGELAGRIVQNEWRVVIDEQEE